MLLPESFHYKLDRDLHQVDSAGALLHPPAIQVYFLDFLYANIIYCNIALYVNTIYYSPVRVNVCSS